MKINKSLSSLFVLGALLAVPASQAAPAMAWESNNFDTGLGSWSGYNNTAISTVDWVNSNLAGGAAGELGGTFVRDLTPAFVARPLDMTVTLNDPLHWKGVFSSTNTFRNWNNSVFIGYFNSTEAVADTIANYVGWRNREPNTGATTGDNYRSRARIGVASNISSPNLQYVQGTSYAFDVQWTPSGNNDGSGTFSGNIGGWAFSQAYGAQSSGPGFDAFGIWWDEAALDTNVKFDAYFDNLEYLVPVPEPSAGMLSLVGFSALWIMRRARNPRL